MVINLRRGRRTRRGKYRRHRKDLVGAQRYRAFLNGVDVTHNTFYVDSRRGVIRMFVRNRKGCIVYDPWTDGAVEIELRGHVKLTRKRHEPRGEGQ